MAQPPAWLRYANQGATRNLPISPQLLNAFNTFLPEMGVTMEVFSGGQPAKGTSSRRVGSVRHDHGNAADVFFSKDGRRLDWANPNDLPVFQEIVSRGKGAGITGFGAGPGYMQPGSMHVGFGSPGVWGAGGKGDNAPEWLRKAYGGPSIGSQVASQVASPPQPSETPAPTFGQPIAIGSAPVATPQPTGIMGAFAPNASATAPQEQSSFSQGITDFKNGNYLDGVNNVFGSMSAGQSQSPSIPPPMQLAPIQGPTGQQATALANYVQSLLGRKPVNG
ncbi:hypothetical protein ACLBWS_05690 [Brucellaceae bacterium D45D]